MLKPFSKIQNIYKYEIQPFTATLTPELIGNDFVLWKVFLFFQMIQSIVVWIGVCCLAVSTLLCIHTYRDIVCRWEKMFTHWKQRSRGKYKSLSSFMNCDALEVHERNFVYLTSVKTFEIEEIRKKFISFAVKLLFALSIKTCRTYSDCFWQNTQLNKNKNYMDLGSIPSNENGKVINDEYVLYTFKVSFFIFSLQVESITNWNKSTMKFQIIIMILNDILFVNISKW